MNILLDTNALIWLLSDAEGKSFGHEAKKLVQDAAVVYASSVSVLEIRIKAMLGKLTVGENLLEDINASGLEELSFTVHHADAIKAFPALSKHDPFDRMLLAQAHIEGRLFLTSDELLLRLGLPFIADARV